MMRVTAVLLGLILFSSVLGAEPERGSICVAALPKPVGGRIGAGPDSVACGTLKFSLKIDDRKPVAWPEKASFKIAALPLTAPHRVVIFCDGKPRQSFRFRFSEYKGHNLCLFLNDLYWTVQLWEAKEAPWCKCR